MNYVQRYWEIQLFIRSSINSWHSRLLIHHYELFSSREMTWYSEQIARSVVFDDKIIILCTSWSEEEIRRVTIMVRMMNEFITIIPWNRHYCYIKSYNNVTIRLYVKSTKGYEQKINYWSKLYALIEWFLMNNVLVISIRRVKLTDNAYVTKLKCSNYDSRYRI